jgi:hypothetical protein
MNNKIIKLFNRDGANLWLEKIEDLEPYISKWQLKVDSGHNYCLKYLRIIGNYPEDIEAGDPYGGPFISLADEFEGKYKIIEILSPIIFKISENGNN